MTRWSTPVRYVEVDQQGVVFNAHYLTYCDEAMAAYCVERDLNELAEQVQLVTSSLTWRSPAYRGETIHVDVRCERVGSSSFAMHFDIAAGERSCCAVDTTYVLVADGRSTRIPDSVREKLS